MVGKAIASDITIVRLVIEGFLAVAVEVGGDAECPMRYLTPRDKEKWLIEWKGATEISMYIVVRVSDIYRDTVGIRTKEE